MVNKEEVVVHFPSPKLIVLGFKDNLAVPLAQIVIIDPEKRQEIIDSVLMQLAGNAACILGDTLVYTDKYDAFQIKEMDNGGN